MDVKTLEALQALRAEVVRMGNRLEAALRDGLAENRRYVDRAADSVRDDLRIIAEGLAAADADAGRPRSPRELN